MAMVTLAAFIVVPKDAVAFDNVNEAVLVMMLGWRHRLWHLPDNHLNQTPIIKNSTPLEYNLRIHNGVSCHNQIVASNATNARRAANG